MRIKYEKTTNTKDKDKSKTNIYVKHKCRSKFRYIILLIFTILLFIFMKFAREYYSERVSVYIREKAITNASLTINSILNDEIISIIDNDNIISKENKAINTIMFNNILKETNKILGEKVNDFSIDKVFIPYSIIFSELLFNASKLGFNVKIRPISSFETDIISVVEEYGINNSILSVYLNVKVNVEIMIPLNKKVANVETNIPLTMIVLSGDIPDGIIYTN